MGADDLVVDPESFAFVKSSAAIRGGEGTGEFGEGGLEILLFLKKFIILIEIQK